MFLFRATIAALFRSRIEREQKEKQERERRKTAALLRDITDPADCRG
jgi:stalled ribosome alternative rescue factor ArfA